MLNPSSGQDQAMFSFLWCFYGQRRFFLSNVFLKAVNKAPDLFLISFYVSVISMGLSNIHVELVMSPFRHDMFTNVLLLGQQVVDYLLYIVPSCAKMNWLLLVGSNRYAVSLGLLVNFHSSDVRNQIWYISRCVTQALVYKHQHRQTITESSFCLISQVCVTCPSHTCVCVSVVSDGELNVLEDLLTEAPDQDDELYNPETERDISDKKGTDSTKENTKDSTTDSTTKNTTNGTTENTTDS